MSRRNSHGFTLVELMMVVLIIGLLMSVLLNAVQSARESARRSVCLSRMRELGSNVNSYEPTNNVYPGWNNRRIGQVIKNNSLEYRTYTEGWINELLPLLGRNDLYAAMHPGPPSGSPGTTQTPGLDSNDNVWLVRASMNDLLVCPSDFDKMSMRDPNLPYPISMVCNAGRQDAPFPGTPAQEPADWRTNAVFMDRTGQRDQFDKPLRPVEATDANFIKNADGLAVTIMLSENLDATNWPNINTGQGEFTSGMIFWVPDNSGHPPKPVHRINGPKGNAVVPSYDTARPSSNHPGGVNMLFADGHGRFVRQEMDYPVFCAMMTPKGGNAMEPGTTNPSDVKIRNQPPIPE
jgi:prepilin-type N-terminal cleavage/methylation domain-containing protein/prepilin-type processing-associated H-X9-DG protein